MKYNIAYTALVTTILTIESQFDVVLSSSSFSGLDEIDRPETRKVRPVIIVYRMSSVYPL